MSESAETHSLLPSPSSLSATMSVGRMKSAVEAQMHRNGALIALAVYLYHSTGWSDRIEAEMLRIFGVANVTSTT